MERETFQLEVIISSRDNLVDQILHVNPKRDSRRTRRVLLARMRIGISITLKQVTAAVWRRSLGIATRRVSMSGARRLFC
jgi:hypothetical protein